MCVLPRRSNFGKLRAQELFFPILCAFLSGLPQQIMKRILFITKNLHLGGGAEKQVVDIANGLRERGFEVGILVFETKGTKSVRAKDLDPGVEIIPAGGQHFRPFPIRCIFETLKAASGWKPDALCSTVWNTKPAAAVAGKLLGTKVVLVEVCSPANELRYNSPKFLLKSLAFSFRKRIYRLADAVVGVSEGTARETKEFFRLKEVRTVQNGIDIGEILEKAAASDEIPHQHFRDGLPVLVAVGRLNVQKGYPHLLEAFRIVNEETEARLTIVGGGKMENDLRRTTKHLGIDDKVTMVGETEPYSYMRHADIFVLPSLWEGLPLVLLEAISLGLPVVSTDCDFGPNEVIENGKSGLLVPVADPVKMAEAIVTLIKDEELRANLGREARKRARHFSSDRMVAGYEEVFTSL